MTVFENMQTNIHDVYSRYPVFALFTFKILFSPLWGVPPPVSPENSLRISERAKLGFGYAYILRNREGSKAPDFTQWCCTDPRINKSSLVKETTVNNKQIRPASHFLPFDSGN